jgi:hypothetical protein
LAQSTLKGEIRFEGSNGKAEEALLQNGNDSLVLLFRAKGSKQWNIYPYQTKKVASSNSRIGSFELSQVENGDYVFANTAESISIISEPAAKKYYEFFPNPSKGFINIKNKGTDPDVFVQIFNQQGSLEMVKSFSRENRDKMQIDLGSLKAGQYVIKINEYSYQLLKL